MSVGTKLLQAAAGNAGDPVYVDDVFSTFLYDGTGSSQTINNGIDLSGEGGLVWIKRRSSTRDHGLFDTERGVNQRLYSNYDLASGTNSSSLTAFNSNGFTVGTESDVNGSSTTNVAWTFRKAEKFFDIVTYTGDGTTSHTINHNLGSVPGMIIVKRTDASANWNVWHRSSPLGGNGKYKDLMLNHPNAAGNSSFWPTTHTSTQFFLGDSDSAINASGGTYVAYLFGHNEAEYGQNSDEAIIKCGSYTGNGNDNGPEIDLGFEPQFYFFKKASGSGSWFIYDTMRGLNVEGVNEQYLNANYDYAETSSNRIAITSTGIKVHDSNDSWNENGATFIYMAIARSHKPASEFAATDLFDTNLTTSDSNVQTSLIRTDFNIQKSRGDSTYWFAQSRLTGNIKYLRPNATTVEADYSTSDPVGVFDTQGQVRSYMGSDSNVIWSFMRAKGFFDVVTYQGTGSFTWFNHNLGVVPELIIFKARNYAQHWNVFTTQGGTTSRLKFNDNGSSITTNQNQFWVNLPTATQFRVGSSDEINGSSYNYIAYFFATVAGISKFGGYTGTGSDLNVDCGFSAGVRFVFIKRTDSNGDWYLYDSARGIVAGNDPYLRVNTSNAEVTNTDYIDPLSSGFTVTSSAPADLNASGGTYIFLAIA